MKNVKCSFGLANIIHCKILCGMPINTHILSKPKQIQQTDENLYNTHHIYVQLTTPGKPI